LISEKHRDERYSPGVRELRESLRKGGENRKVVGKEVSRKLRNGAGTSSVQNCQCFCVLTYNGQLHLAPQQKAGAQRSGSHRAGAQRHKLENGSPRPSPARRHTIAWGRKPEPRFILGSNGPGEDQDATSSKAKGRRGKRGRSDCSPSEVATKEGEPAGEGIAVKKAPGKGHKG